MHPSRPRRSGAIARVTAVALFAALALVVAAPGPAGAADDDVPWAVRTASNGFGSDRPNYGYTVNPGGRVDDALVVVNRGTTPLELAVYAADGFTTDAGTLDLATADIASKDVGAWVHPDRDHLSIRPGESIEVPFSVDVPADATPGDHMGGIVTSLTQADEADGTDVNRRLAIRIRLRVSGELKPSLSVEALKVHYSGAASPFANGDAGVSYTIHNTGNTILTARQAASLSGPFGRFRVGAGHVEDSPQLLPGGSWKVSVPVHGVNPALRLTATVTLTPLLTDAAGSISALSTVKTTARAWAVPWSLLLVLGALLVVVLAFRHRRRRARPQAATGVQDNIAPAPRAHETSLQ